MKKTVNAILSLALMSVFGAASANSPEADGIDTHSEYWTKIGQFAEQGADVTKIQWTPELKSIYTAERDRLKAGCDDAKFIYSQNQKAGEVALKNNTGDMLPSQIAARDKANKVLVDKSCFGHAQTNLKNAGNSLLDYDIALSQIASKRNAVIIAENKKAMDKSGPYANKPVTTADGTSDIKPLSVVSNQRAPAVNDKLSFADMNYAIDAHSFFGSKGSIGHFTGMTSLPVDTVVIDLDRIAKHNGDSDMYVYWLITNSNYKSIIAAFKNIYTTKPYSLADSTESNPGSERYAEVNQRCDNYMKTDNDIVRYPGIKTGWVCRNFENMSSFRQPSATPIADALALGNVIANKRTGFLEYNITDDEHSRRTYFKVANARIGFAYMALYNAAQVASTGVSNSFLITSMNKQLDGFYKRSVENAKALGLRDKEDGKGLDGGAINKFWDKLGLRADGKNTNKFEVKGPFSFDEALAINTALTGESIEEWGASIESRGHGMTAAQMRNACFGANPTASASFCSRINEDGTIK